MTVRNERKEAIAIINMFNYLERELRDSLDDEHLADLSRVISDELTRKYAATREETYRLIENQSGSVVRSQ